jgi:hypothetical protein
VPRLEALEPRVLLSLASERFVSALYPEMLGRQADPSGLAYFGARLDAGVSRQNVVRELESSAEDRTKVVQQVFLDLLQRPADSEALTTFLPLLASGAGVQQVEALVAGSPEYVTNRGGGTMAGFLTALYKDALGRYPDPDGLAAFTSALQGGSLSFTTAADLVFSSPEARGVGIGNDYARLLLRPVDSSGLSGFLTAEQHGAREEDVIAAIAGSAEYYTRKVDPRGSPARILVTGLYQDFLGRTPGPSELAAWVPQLEAGTPASVVATGILASGEYGRRALDEVYRELLRRPVDTGGINSFLPLLGSGTGIQQIKAQVAGSPEYIASRSGGTVEGFIGALYQDALGRAPGDLSTFTTGLRDGSLSFAAAAQAVFTSSEAWSVQVQSAYRQLLRRSPDMGEVNSLTALLRGGAPSTFLFATLAGSPEYGDVIENEEAVSFTGQGSGVFVDPQGGTTQGEGTNDFSWGEPFGDGGSSSSVSFTGQPFDAAPGQTFILGTLQYANGVTQIGTETAGFTLRATLQFDNPAGVEPQSFDLPLSVLTTENTNDQEESSDSLFLPAPSDSTVIVGPDGHRYGLRFMGFGKLSGSGSETIDHFFVHENESASADLLAQLVPAAPSGVSILVNKTADESDDISNLGQLIQATIVNGTNQAEDLILTIVQTGGASVPPASLSEYSRTVNPGDSWEVTIDPLTRSNSANDVILRAWRRSGEFMASQDMTFVDISLAQVRAADTPIGMPDRIPPTAETPLPIGIGPDLTGSKQSVSVEIVGQDPQTSGTVLVNAVDTRLQSVAVTNLQNPVTLKGVKQTVATNGFEAGNAGHLVLVVKVRGEEVARSAGFSVAAIPNQIEITRIDSPIFTSPFETNSLLRNKIGMRVAWTLHSDSGDLKDLEGSVTVQEEVKPDPSGFDPYIFASGPLEVIPTHQLTDLHTVSRFYVKPGNQIVLQGHLFSDRRTGAQELPIAGSGFVITFTDSSAGGAEILETRKEPANVITRTGIQFTAGKGTLAQRQDVATGAVIP